MLDGVEEEEEQFNLFEFMLRNFRAFDSDWIF